MFGKLLLLFTVVPVMELYLLISIGKALGAELTIGLVLVTGLLGASLARREGSRVVRNWQEAMAQGQIPKEGVISSLLVLVGGVLLVTPGVVTDITGLSLLFPWTRRMVANVVRRQLETRFSMRTIVHDPEAFASMAASGPLGVNLNGGSPFGDANPPQGDVIDVDAVDHEQQAHAAEQQTGIQRS